MNNNEIILADFEVLSDQYSVRNWWNDIGGVDPDIIQMSAIKVSLADKNLKVVEEFSALVLPRDSEHHIAFLTDHIQKLTGITQACMRSEGVELQEAVNSFKNFIQNSIVYNYSRTFDFTVLTMSMVRQNLTEQLFDRKQFKDIRPVFIKGGVPAALMPQNCQTGDVEKRYETVNSGRIAGYLGTSSPATYQEHDGLYDARSVLFGLRKLLAENKIMLSDLQN